MTGSHGTSPLRKDDARLLRGRGRFVDNIHLDRMVHAAFVRSPLAHADILSIDTPAARAAGALAVFTAANVPFNDTRWIVRYWHRSIRNGLIKFLAHDRVRYVGEPVALVIAPDRYLAEDFAQLVEVEYRALPAITTIEDAVAPTSMPLHPQWIGNVAASFEHTRGDAAGALTGAHHRTRRRFTFVRQAPVPLETRGVVADFDLPRQTLTAWISTQPPFGPRSAMQPRSGSAR